jgi:CRISPR-associated protein Cmr4
MNSHNAILGLFTETSLHAGAGQALGVIDLPIMREAHTAWPCVFGSAVKGALRARAETDKDGEKRLSDEISLIFGPALDKQGERIEYAGALSVGDARLLLLPVRSLTTHFRWATCPAALGRFKRDAERLGIAGLGDFEVPGVSGEAALVAEAVNGGHLFLEEYRFEAQAADLSAVVAALAKLMPESAGKALSAQLAIVADDHFRHLAEHATPVNAHVSLDSKTKTVKGGMLWYEETLPPESLLYVGLNAVKARKKDSALEAEAVLSRLREALFGAHPYLQLGGNETVGMGWCRAAFLSNPKTEG